MFRLRLTSWESKFNAIAISFNILTVLFYVNLFVFHWQSIRPGLIDFPDPFSTLLIGVMVTPIISICAIVRRPTKHPNNNGRSWLQLFFERKRLEERRKIKQLREANKDH